MEAWSPRGTLLIKRVAAVPVRLGPGTSRLPRHPGTSINEIELTRVVLEEATVRWPSTLSRTFQPAPERYMSMLDDHNHAQPGSDSGSRWRSKRQPGAAGSPVVTNLAVEVFYDDGHSCRNAPVTRNGTHWLATVDKPAAGTVSLRAKATDTDGNELEQTIIRVYLFRAGTERVRHAY